MEFFFFTFDGIWIRFMVRVVFSSLVCVEFACIKVATPGATECRIFPGSFEAYAGVKKKA